MITLAGAINIQQHELSRVQRETAAALGELCRVKEEVAEQRRAKTEAYNEEQSIYDTVHSLSILANSLETFGEELKRNTNADIAKLQSQNEQIKIEVEKKIAILKQKNDELSGIGNLDGKLLEKKLELNAEIAKFRKETDKIEAKRLEMIKESERLEKLKQDLKEQAEINKSEKSIIEMKRRELVTVEKELKGIQKELRLSLKKK